MINLKINNKDIKAEEGKSLLEVIRENNIDYVPTLCHNDQIEPITSCFLCVTEVEGARGLRPSCSTEITEGMVVKTDTERIKESRKTNLELLLSNHYADCYPPCKLGCPANVDIQGYIALASRGLYGEALKLMKETNPFPMVCGRVCAHPCEDACRRNFVDEPVDIKNIKRFLADRDIYSQEPYMPEIGSDTGKRVAIIGSGPAGLTAAYYLRMKGHGATIFEKLPKAGGMMRYGIPEYRLPKEDLQKEIDLILDMGAEIKFNRSLGKDMTLEDLEKEYDSVFLGIGAQNGNEIGIKGEDLKGVSQGVDYLREVALGNDPETYGNVFIIGGGNSAIDASRTALRMGADKVTIIYRRTEKEMPADDLEIEDAKEEGIDIRILSNPVEYIGENGRIKSVKIIKMELGEPDSSGRRRPVEIEESEYIEDVDFIIEALGQKMDASGLDGIKLAKWGTIEADEELLLTNRKGVFAGGDAVLGPDIIISAVAHGRKAAYGIDRYLNGEELIPENRLGFYIAKDDFKKLSDEDFSDKEKMPRKSVEKENPEMRIKSMTEVELGFTEENLLEESARCMECGCQDIHECKLKEYSKEYNADKMKFLGGSYRVNEYDSKHRYIAIDTEKCINCGQCLKICSTIEKQDVITYNMRGFNTTIVPVNYTALDDTNCISCGACVSACPTGAITETAVPGKPGPFENRLTESHCNLCGDGCKIVVETRDDNFIKISSKIKNSEFFGNLCSKGRFGYEEFNLTKKDIAIPDTQIVKDKLSSVLNDKTLIAVSPYLTLEEIDLIAEYSKKQNVDMYSFEIGNDREKITILKENNISLETSLKDKIEEYENVFIFGEYSENENSVSFREFIKNDKSQNIFTSDSNGDIYFRRTAVSSDRELVDLLKSKDGEKNFILFNLQNIDSVILKDLTHIMKNSDSGYTVLNSYPNYSFLLAKIDLGITDRIKDNSYSSLISINCDESLITGNFSNRISFSDRGDKKDLVPLKSIYEKTGTFYTQKGEKKSIIKAAKSNLYSLENFFK